MVSQCNKGIPGGLVVVALQTFFDMCHDFMRRCIMARQHAAYVRQGILGLGIEIIQLGQRALNQSREFPGSGLDVVNLSGVSHA